MRKLFVIGASFVCGCIGYFFMNEKIATDIWREVSLDLFVTNGSMLIGVCFYIGLIVTPEYTKMLAEDDSTKTMRMIDRIFSKLVWFYTFAFLFYFGWHIGLNSFIDGYYMWNAFLLFVLSFVFISWTFKFVEISRLVLDIVKVISIRQNAGGR